MIRFSKPQILLLHEQLIAETGGSSGLRDEGMLDSALNAPFQSFDGEDVYPSLQQKAARLCFGLVKNHPFPQGTYLPAYNKQRYSFLGIPPLCCIVHKNLSHQDSFKNGVVVV